MLLRSAFHGCSSSSSLSEAPSLTLSPLASSWFSSPSSSIPENSISELSTSISSVPSLSESQKIVEKTNYYARQKVADNEQRLGRWRDVCKPEVKAYFGMCVIMGMNILPMVPDYWSTDIFNEGIKRVIPKNRFEEISQFLLLNDSSREPARDVNFDRLYKFRPALNAVLRNVQRCYLPTKNLSVDVEL